MITAGLEQIKDKSEFDMTGTAFALRHFNCGVGVAEYFILGSVFLHALEVLLGPLYISPVHAAWQRMYSSILTVVVPASLKYATRVNVSFTMSEIKEPMDTSETCSLLNEVSSPSIL